MTKEIHKAKQLLEQVPVIIKKCEEHYRKSGSTYNIFKIAGIGHREVNICRVLADLINPKGLHSQGDLYLKLFRDEVLKPHIEKACNLNLSKVKITTEYSTSEGRFIDIVIDDGTIFIPIEAKIHAGEQEKQLADYAVFSSRKNVNSGFIPVLFLTPDGRESSEASKDIYKRISFEKCIIPWLEKCLNLEETQKIPPVREIIKQFIRAIKSFCGHMEDEGMENEINNLIEKRDNYAAATLIFDAVKSYALNVDNKIWDTFKEGGKIYSLVEKKLPGVKLKYLQADGWRYLAIPIGKDCTLSINYDMTKFSVSTNSKKSLPTETADKIRKTMSKIITVVCDEEWGGVFLWASKKAKYPKIDDVDNYNLYLYDLHRIYSEEPEKVADWIVSLVTELKEIFK